VSPRVSRTPHDRNAIFRRVAATGATLAIAAVAPPALAAGTWTAAPSSPTNGGPAFGLWLLTDGTVLSHGNALNKWVKLTPDKTGSYANGTWTTVATSAYARGGAQEHVLKDGRFFEAGGEFIYIEPGCTANCAQPPNGSPLFKNVEIYDPVADTWTIEASGLFDIGDTGSATMADGRILDSTRTGSQTQIYDPTANAWTAGPNIPSGSGDENAWSALQNGGFLAVAPHGASIYDPATNTWKATGALPAALTVNLPQFGAIQFGDVAGVSLMFDGRVLAYGEGTTAIYTPGPTAADPGTWAAGPDLLTGAVTTVEPGNEAEDEYTVTEPNGKVMVPTYPFQGSPNLLQEYDPTTNTFASIPPPPDRSGPYPVSFLNLPNGQVMVTAGALDWLYTPDSAPQDAWRPTVTSVAFNGNATYTLTGTQISGLINGGDEGDDMTMAENYPIVWLTDASGNVFYCRTFNFSSMVPSVGPAPETAQFTTPAALPAGSYQLFVSAVGVPSKVGFGFTVGVGGTGPSDAGAVVVVDAGAPVDAGKAMDAGKVDASVGDAGRGSSSGTGSSSSGSGSSNGGGSSSGTTGSSSGSSSGVTTGSSGAPTGSSGGNSSGAVSSSSSGAGSSGASNDAGDGSGEPGTPSGCGCGVVGEPDGPAGLALFLGGIGMVGVRWRRRPRKGGSV
jgi:MYXO-CTERM domain-containing protein